MKKTYFVILILVFPTLTIGQMNQSIDFVVGLDYSFRHLTNSNGDEILNSIIDSRNAEERGKLNFRLGFNYNTRLNNNWVFKSGLRIASIGYKTEKKELFWPSDHDGNGGVIFQLINDYWFLELPLMFRFEMGNKKLASFFEVGISPSIYVTTRVKRTIENTSNAQFQRDAQIQNMNIAGVIAYGLNYNISEKIQFFGQLAVRYHFTSLVSASINEHLYNYGLEFGLRHKIN